MARVYLGRAQREGLTDDLGEQQFPPRTTEPNHEARFTVPAGTKCAVRKITESENEYRSYTTKQQAGFAKFERWIKSETGNYYEFREQGWLMLVRSNRVRQRKSR